MAVHRKLDRTRVYLGAGEFRKCAFLNAVEPPKDRNSHFQRNAVYGASKLARCRLFRQRGGNASAFLWRGNELPLRERESVRADEKLTAFVELQSAIRPERIRVYCRRTPNQLGVNQRVKEEVQMYQPTQLKTRTLPVRNSISRSPLRRAFILRALGLICLALSFQAQATTDDFSAGTFDPKKGHRGVHLQQGHIQTPTPSSGAR
jgi:hypothetical protein